MHNSIDDVLAFIEDNPEYRATIGLIKTRNAHKSYLSWAAVNEETDEKIVPYLSSIQKLHPNAKWTPLTPKELRHFLRHNKQKAFLMSKDDLNNSLSDEKKEAQGTSASSVTSSRFKH